MDRLTRRPIELEQFLDVLTAATSWLEAEGITRVGGGPWRTPTLRAQRAEAGIDAVPDP